MNTPANSPWIRARKLRHISAWRTAPLLEWAKLGKIPAHRLSGVHRCTWRFRADELDAILTAPSAASEDHSNATK